MLQLTEVNQSASHATRKLSRLKTWNLWAISDNVPTMRLEFPLSLILCVRVNVGLLCKTERSRKAEFDSFPGSFKDVVGVLLT